MGDSFAAPQLSTIDAFNCKKQLAGNGKLWPEEEEIVFLRSLGWEENGWEENGEDDDDDEEEEEEEEEEEGGYLTQEEKATTHGGDAFNCKKHLVGNCELCLEDEEIAFLCSLGWEENGDEDDEEGDLTEEEIAAFYTYVSNHILQLKLKPKPALRYTLLHHNTAIFSFST
nr:mediator of RNA polymerase II transcription subunit 1 [Ipomoea batatas]